MKIHNIYQIKKIFLKLNVKNFNFLINNSNYKYNILVEINFK